MKRISVFLLFCFLAVFNGFSQDIINNPVLETNEAIHQISTSGIDNILSFQNSNQGLSNFVLSQQLGDQNKANISQQRDPGTPLTNQAYSFQQGNFNELTLGQIGSGNQFLCFQLGYITTTIAPNQLSGYSSGLALEGLNSLAVENQIGDNGILSEGTHNKIEVSQEGSNNGILAVQQGDENFISTGQNGRNNYLLVFQRGTKNSVKDYKQENSSETVLFDTVIQEGENISLVTDAAPRSTPNRNTFSQTGSNLSLGVNNGLINSAGGIEVTQTGSDMKVIVDQSYFPNPLQ